LTGVGCYALRVLLFAPDLAIATTIWTNDMVEIVAVALGILTVAVVIIKIAVRDDDVLNGRFFERSDYEK
jgi:hypothetical protein